MPGTTEEELEAIKLVLDGTTAGTPIRRIADALEALLAVFNGNTTGTPISNLVTQADDLDNTLQTVKTAIDNINIGVTVSDVTVDQTLSTRRPLAEAGTIRKDNRERKVAARNPLKPSIG